LLLFYAFLCIEHKMRKIDAVQYSFCIFVFASERRFSNKSFSYSC